MPIEPVDIPPGVDQEEGEAATAGVPPRPTRKPGPGMGKLKSQVAELYATLGMMVVTPIDPLAGHLLAANAEDIADQWIALAETNASVKRVLQNLVEVGGWGGVVMAHGMILMPVLANRGLFPDHVAGPVAVATTMQTPSAGPLFTHARFREPAPESGPHVVKNGDGSGD